jgi:hypothetical protein
MNEDLKKIFEGMDLTESFKKNFETIYESRIDEERKKITEEVTESVTESVEEKYSVLAEEYGQYVVTETEDKMNKYLTEEVMPSIEKYLDHVALEFVTENKLVIESETKVELADKFLSGFSQIAEAYNVTVPVGQDDVVVKLKANLAEANAEVDKLISQNVQLKEQVESDVKNDIVDSAAKNMTDTQKERFVESCAKIKFHDIKQYTSVISEMKDSFSIEDKKVIKEDKELDTKVVIKESSAYLDSIFSRI